MRNAWYVACRSEELGEELVTCTILSTELLLYRDRQGSPHVLHNQCAHRGARLSDGRIKGDCVACPFHGWEYGGDGACRYIPANGPDVPVPKGARVASYPVRELAGLVWVFVGEAERAGALESELPPELLDAEWRAVHFEMEWEAHVTRVVESVLDVSHLPFVHPEATGEDVNPVVEGPAFSVTEREIEIRAKPYHPLVRTPLNQEEKGDSTITFSWPNQLMLRTDMFEGNQMCTFLALTPVDEERIKIYGVALRNFLQELEVIDGVHYEHNVKVLEQDRPIVEGLRPKVAPLEVEREVHVRSDAPQVRYRMMYRKMVGRSERDEG